MLNWLERLAVAILVGLSFGIIYIIGRIVYDTYNPYKHMTCVDMFTKQAFSTDRMVKAIEHSGDSYVLYKNGWDITVIPKTPNMICSLSREYPNDGSTSAITQPEEIQGQASSGGYPGRDPQVN